MLMFEVFKMASIIYTINYGFVYVMGVSTRREGFPLFDYS